MNEGYNPVHEFISYISVEKGLSPNTRLAYEKDLEQYVTFCESKGLDVLRVELKDLRQFLARLRGRQLSSRTLARKLTAVKQLYKFLLREDRIESDPAELLSISLKNRTLPKVLSVKEMVSVIEAATGATEAETRDRALLELWYATGCRISELVQLKISNLDLKEGVVKFQGKGGKERLVPVHKQALEWCEKYKAVRHKWVLEAGLTDSHCFFLTQQAKEFSRQGMWKIVKKYAQKAGIPRRVWPHMIRHTFATHILNGGADLRAVQELLGHRSISTTEVYTHLDIENLKSMQLKYHPRS
ncbi:MAG: tyrosine recombinase [Bdellovibrionota bacterium]